jgi:hypothetical protein
MGSGKSTAAGVLEREYGFRRIALADPLYQLAECANRPDRLIEAIEVVADVIAARCLVLGPMNDWPKDVNYYAVMGQVVGLWQKHGAALTRWQAAGCVRSLHKPRAFLQALGTDVFRAINEDIWLKHFLQRALRLEGPLVCDDVRFPNEVRWIGRAGWALVRCECPEEVRLGRVAAFYGEVSAAEQAHVSEQDLGERAWAYVLDCSGSMEEEAREVRAMVEELDRSGKYGRVMGVV